MFEILYVIFYHEEKRKPKIFSIGKLLEIFLIFEIVSDIALCKILLYHKKLSNVYCS